MLNRTSYFIREHVGVFKLSDTYDILDPDTHDQIGIAKEKPGLLYQLLRFVINKRMLPTKVYVYEGSDSDDQSQLLFSIQRGFTLFRSKINVCGPDGTTLGWFKQKLITLGGAFRIFSASGQEVALVKGDWKGWNFKFLDSNDQQIGVVTKKWAGLGKELFTSADNYIITVDHNSDPNKALLLLAAGLAIDIVYKEK